MIEGHYDITIKLPGLGLKNDELTAHGEFKVNSRQELLDYLAAGADAIETQGRELLAVQ